SAVSLLTWAVGHRAFDRQSLTRLGKTLAVCAVVTGAHVALSDLGPWRLALSAGLYLLLVFAVGAVRLDELLGLVRVVRRRGAPVQPSAAA
ncbi:MAG TPA: flippase, partial [Myxococcaceae bacterium]